MIELTKEQYDIINSTGDIKINAVAGSGKTTTVIEYAKARPRNSKILYLAFNKSVRLEAARKFSDCGLTNVTVETAHSLAFKHVVSKGNYRLRSQGYKSHEIVPLLDLQGNSEKHTEYIIANHINKYVTYFCNSDKLKVQDLNYLDVVSDDDAKKFVTTFYKYIQSQTRQFLSKMDKGEIEITHDFYLKKFQLLNPKLGFDYILFDEGQDASPAMLDVFLKQKAVKVIVGDTHQQIYSWRYAVNSLEKADFKTYHLSTSFRFSQDIADLAMEILNWKSHLGDYKPLPITGKGNDKTDKAKAILARTNLGLLLKAIEYVTEKKKVKQIYFEGNINSYTYADEGTSLYDVLNLSNGKHHLIKDVLLKQMGDLDDLEEYIKKTEDGQLSMMVEIVKEYGDDIPAIIKTIKDKHVPNEEKDKAEMVFSTVHRCKGMEYDTIQIVNDFTSEEKLLHPKIDPRDLAGIAKLNEEINLLYVAVTRSKNEIHIPKSLMPENFPFSPHIHLIESDSSKGRKETERNVTQDVPTNRKVLKQYPKEKHNLVIKVGEKSKEAFQPWTEELDDELTIMYCKGVYIKEMAEHFKRTKGAIWSRIRKLELEDLYG
ncbi:MAG: UvrD-helicase domain-containing protein [Mariniphaga sp.]